MFDFEVTVNLIAVVLRTKVINLGKILPSASVIVYVICISEADGENEKSPDQKLRAGVPT